MAGAVHREDWRTRRGRAKTRNLLPVGEELRRRQDGARQGSDRRRMRKMVMVHGRNKSKDGKKYDGGAGRTGGGVWRRDVKQSVVRQRIAGDGPGALAGEAAIRLDDDPRVEGRRQVLVLLQSVAAAISTLECVETHATQRMRRNTGDAAEERDGGRRRPIWQRDDVGGNATW
jgi:hypothetical protein